MDWIRYDSFDDIPKLDCDKPLAYLDQNVLDWLVKSSMDSFKTDMINCYQIVYSEHTISEIAAAEENGSAEDSLKFLCLLRELQAMHIRPLNDGGTKEYERLAIKDIDPSEQMEEFKTNTDYVYVMQSMKEQMEKLYGGLKDKSLAELSGESLITFSTLTAELETNITEIEHLFPELAEKLRAENTASLNKFRKTVKTYKEAYGEIANKKDWAPITEFRDAIKKQPYQFDDISPPNIIEQIWERISEVDGVRCFSIEQFFRIDKNYIYPDLPLTDRQKVSAMYSMLNYIGYRPDTALTSKRGFKRSYHDLGHASIASGVDYLFTFDERMASKCVAIYEYLGLTTKVILMK